jgi:hypothetical protein
MKRDSLAWKFVWVVLTVFLAVGVATPAAAAITATAPFRSTSLSDPVPPVFGYVSSTAYYDGNLIYAGNDQKIYSYDIATGTSTELWDLSGDANFSFGPSGFLVSFDDYLYFHDNGKTDNIYRIDLTAPALDTLATGANGSIFAFTQNPFTAAIWFASADFGAPNNMYLYEVNAGFGGVTQSGSGFAQPNGGGNGPIIFTGETTILYGESVFLGDGYFHLVDSDTGTIISENYLTFDGGLASADYGYDDLIFVTTGNGKQIFRLQGTSKTSVASTTDAAQGIVFDGDSFYVSEMTDFGDVSFSEFFAPAETFLFTPLADPVPPVLSFVSSIGYYDGSVIYAGNDLKIYAYDTADGTSTELWDLSGDPNFNFGPSGFMVSSDNYLYFHDNGNTQKIYRIELTAPGAPDELDTGANGSIFAFTQNPFTDAIWFASSDFGAPNNMYLYEVNAGFGGVTQSGSGFAQPNGGGNGPIIFTGETTVLYGESVFLGDGYFHLVDSDTGTIIAENYLTFDGGLVAADCGYDDLIFVTTGNGKQIFKLQGGGKTAIASTTDAAQGIVFGGNPLFVSEMTDTGEVSFSALEPVSASSSKKKRGGGGGGGCFIGTAVQGTMPYLQHVFSGIAVCFLLFAGSCLRRARNKK